MKAMKNKKWICGIGAVLVCVMLTGCCMSHEWQEATCATPKTCSNCGETEGTILEHTWEEATCAAPKICSVCGATEGEALEHTLKEANYQQPPTCEVCGQTEGEPLQADFEKYNLAEKLIELDKEYDCVVACDDGTHSTNAKLILSNYQTFTSGTPEKSSYFTFDTELPEESGYEYKIVDVTINFSDENAIVYGASVFPTSEDYYDIVGRDESYTNKDDGWQQFTVNWNGTDYTECIHNYFTEWITNDDGTYSYNAMFIARVPVGYDGYMLGFRNALVEWEEGKHIFELDNTDTLFFRFE